MVHPYGIPTWFHNRKYVEQVARLVLIDPRILAPHFYAFAISHVPRRILRTLKHALMKEYAADLLPAIVHVDLGEQHLRES